MAEPSPTAVVAEPERRFQAFAIDRALAWSIYAGAVAAAWWFFFREDKLWPGIGLIVGVVLLVSLAFAVQTGLTGRTPGKALRGLKVVDPEGGGPIGIGRSLVRSLIVGSGSLPMFGLGVATLAWTAVEDRTRERRGWHDHVARSIVIDTRPRPVIEAEAEDKPRHVVNLTAMKLMPVRASAAPVVPAPAPASSGGQPQGEPARPAAAEGTPYAPDRPAQPASAQHAPAQPAPAQPTPQPGPAHASPQQPVRNWGPPGGDLQGPGAGQHSPPASPPAPQAGQPAPQAGQQGTQTGPQGPARHTPTGHAGGFQAPQPPAGPASQPPGTQPPGAQQPGSQPPAAQAPGRRVAPQGPSVDGPPSQRTQARPAAGRHTGPRAMTWRVSFDSGESFVVEGLGIVGRAPVARPGEPVRHAVPLKSDNMSISKTHAQFHLASDGALVVTDRGSTNGSVLVRKGVSRELAPGRPTTLVDGDRVVFGDRSMSVTREG